MITEYCPNGSLSELLLRSDSNLSWREVYEYGRSIALGLQYLHQQSPVLCHGNLKSSNILVNFISFSFFLSFKVQMKHSLF
jgi:serine/threonine protein kinase